MPNVDSFLAINAPIADLFRISQDYYSRLDWDPFVREIKFLDGATEAAVRVRVYVKAKNGLSMTVEYITVEPPEYVAIKMVQGPMLFQRFAGTWRFEKTDSGESIVRFCYNFTTRWPLLRPLIDPVISFIFKRDIKARLEGLKRYAENNYNRRGR